MCRPADVSVARHPASLWCSLTVTLHEAVVRRQESCRVLPAWARSAILFIFFNKKLKTKKQTRIGTVHPSH